MVLPIYLENFYIRSELSATRPSIPFFIEAIQSMVFPSMPRGTADIKKIN
jgi:hypothetical protein